MSLSPFRRLPLHLALAIALCLAARPAARAAAFPPLTSPAVDTTKPGKLVWADLFTTEPDKASLFYRGLLGWTAEAIDQKGRSYVIFRNGTVPVAGLSVRSVKGPGHPSRWIGYLSVNDVAATLELAAKDGALVRAPLRAFPDRGTQAIVTDHDQIPVGLIHSSSGDSADSEPKVGTWNWFELYVKDPRATADSYHAVFGYTASVESGADKASEFILSSAGEARGGIAPLPSGEPASASWLGVIRVADLDKTLARVPGLGGEVLLPPRDSEQGSRFAIILDSTGGTLGLVEYVDNTNPASHR